MVTQEKIVTPRITQIIATEIAVTGKQLSRDLSSIHAN